MCGSKGSAPSPSGASTTTASNTQGTSTGVFAQGPSSFASPLYQDFLNRANSLSTTPFDPSTQATVAPLNAQQTGGLNQLFNLGMDMGNFDPAKVQSIESPFIQDVVGSTQNWFNNQNQIQSNSLLGQGIRSGNAFGGDRMGVAQAEMAGQQQLAQAPVISGLYQSGYTQALDEYNKLKQFGVTGAQEAIKAGTVSQAQQQREADVAQQNAMMRQAYPFQLANWYGSALGGIAPLTGTVGSAQTASTAATEGISNPPTPNPLSQALGIGSSLVGIGGGLGLFKSGGYIDDESDDDSDGYDSGDQSYQQDSAPPEEDNSEISKKTGKPKTDYERELESISSAGTPQSPPNLFGKGVAPVKFKQPYSVLEKAQKASGGSGGSSSSSNTTPQSAASKGAPSPQEQGSGVARAVGTVGGAILGGPVGAAIGGAGGSIVDSLFASGGPVGKYADGEEVDDEEEDTRDEGDTGDTGDAQDTGDTNTVVLPGVTVSTAAPTTTVANAAPATTPAVATPAAPVGGEQPPAWLNPNTALPTPRPAPTERTGKRIEQKEPSEQQPTTRAGDRGYTVRRIPELGPRPKTFAERWASNPFTQAGIAMLGNTSPHFGVGLAHGLGAASGSIQASRRQDLLDAKPQLITSGDTVHARSGDMLIDTRIPTMTRAQSEANKRIKARQDAIDARGGRQSSPDVMQRHIDTNLRMGAKETLKILEKDPDWAGRDPKERALEADILTREHWNATHDPKYHVPVPTRPVKPAEPAVEPAQPGIMSKVGPVLRKAWEGFTTDVGKGYNLITTGKEEGNAPATAAPAAPAKPAAPAQAAPAQAAPAQAAPAQPQRNQIIDDLKSGKVTKEQILEDARKAAAGGKNQSIIRQRLQDAGIDPNLINAPMPNQRPNVPMSQ